MAIITQCKICGTNVCNAQFCHECQEVMAERYYDELTDDIGEDILEEVMKRRHGEIKKRLKDLTDRENITVDDGIKFRC